MLPAHELGPVLHRLSLAVQSGDAPPEYFRALKQFHEYSAVLYALTLVFVLMVAGIVFNKISDVVMLLIAGLKLRLSK